MATPCLCDQATAAPTCALVAGAGITLTGSNPTTISAHSAVAWTSYLPLFTNFTLGTTGAVNGSRYLLNGKTLDVEVLLKFGTGATFGASEWEISLPSGITPFFDANLLNVGHTRGVSSMRDVSAANPWFEGDVFLSNTGRPLRVRFGDDAAGIANTNTVKSTIPFTWAVGDELTLKARIEVV